MKTIADTLLAAAALIEKKGWGQHTLINFEGNYCLMGAVGEVCGVPLRTTIKRSIADIYDNLNKLSAIQALAGCIKDISPSLASRPSHVIPNWNDASGRSHEEVVKLLRDCAARQEAK